MDLSETVIQENTLASLSMSIAGDIYVYIGLDSVIYFLSDNFQTVIIWGYPAKSGSFSHFQNLSFILR